MRFRSTTFFTAFGALLALVLASAPALAQGPPADAINMSQVAVYNSPADIASWPVTTAITRVDMQRPDGLSFTFSARNTWPDYLPPGWDGPLQVHGLGGGEGQRPVVHVGIHPDVEGPCEHRRADPDGLRQELGVRLALGSDDGPPARGRRADGFLRFLGKRARRHSADVRAGAVERGPRVSAGERHGFVHLSGPCASCPDGARTRHDRLRR